MSGMLQTDSSGRSRDTIAEGKDVTYDLKPERDDPTAVGTSEMTDAIIRRLGA